MTLFRATRDGRVPLTQAEESEVAADQLVGAKDRKIQTMISSYETETQADIVFAGNTYVCTQDRQDLLARILSVGSVPAGMYWRDKTDTNIPATITDLQGLGLAILDRGLSAHANLSAKIAAINAASSIAEIDAVTWV